jgi:hypothetical protein
MVELSDISGLELIISANLPDPVSANNPRGAKISEKDTRSLGQSGMLTLIDARFIKMRKFPHSLATIAAQDLQKAQRFGQGQATKGKKMTRVLIPSLMIAMALTACGAPPQPPQAAPFLQAAVPEARLAPGVRLMRGQYRVVAIDVVVPKTLRVSEANSFRPNADIVWRGDARGNRYDQIKAIFDTAAARGVAKMHSGPKVRVEIEVTKFHAVTEKTRFTIGGVHSMHFLLTVRDAKTGAIVQGPRLIVADVQAAGGQAALAEEAAGRTQKVVVTERLAAVIRRELSVEVHGAPNLAASARQ